MLDFVKEQAMKFIESDIFLKSQIDPMSEVLSLMRINAIPSDIRVLIPT